MAIQGFKQVGETDTDARVVEHPNAQHATVTAQALAIALRALSQRAVTALSSLFTAGTVLSAWWLWLQAPPDPSTRQLVGLALYALFILALHGIRRRGAQ